MIQSIFKLIVSTLMVLCFVVQATGITVPGSCDDLEPLGNYQVSDNVGFGEDQDDCCDLDCCDANCFCLGGASSTAVYLPHNLLNLKLSLPDNSVIAEGKSLPNYISNSLYRPPITA